MQERIGIWLFCHVCSKLFYRTRRKYFLSLKKKSTYQYCSRECHFKNIHNKNKESNTKERYIERFWSNVNKLPGLGPKGDCWEWLGAVHHSGYGVYNSKSVHRLAYEITHNIKLNSNNVIMHECDNRLCVRHLKLGTQLENIKDMVNKGRHACGERNSTSKIKDKDVVFIRQNVNKYSRKEFMEMFNICEKTLSNIIRYITFKHLPMYGCIPPKRKDALPIPKLNKKDLKRFYSYIQFNRTEDVCYEWLINKGEKYGGFSIGGRAGKSYQAHRISYELYYDDKLKPEDLVRHLCNNTRCVNGKHLAKGTSLDNSNDARLAGRTSAGERSNFSKLTEKDVLEIRSENNNHLTCRELSKIYNVGRDAIYDIRRNRTWKHLLPNNS